MGFIAMRLCLRAEPKFGLPSCDAAPVCFSSLDSTCLEVRITLIESAFGALVDHKRCEHDVTLPGNTGTKSLSPKPQLK